MKSLKTASNSTITVYQIAITGKDKVDQVLELFDIMVTKNISDSLPKFSLN